MKILALVIFLATGSILSADIVTNVTCTVGLPNDSSNTTVTDPNRCSLQAPGEQPFGQTGMASATASASFSLANNPSNFSSLTANQLTMANPSLNNIGVMMTPTFAGSSVSVNEMLFTLGDVRSGFVQISATASAAGGFRGSDGSLDLYLGSIVVDCSGPGMVAFCTLRPNGAYTLPSYNLPVNAQSYPFTLGQQFSLTYSGFAGAFGNSYGGNEGYANIQFQFQFFEADGVTPVAVELAPEPETFALLGIGLVALAAGTQKLRRCFTLRQGFSESNSNHV